MVPIIVETDDIIGLLTIIRLGGLRIVATTSMQEQMPRFKENDITFCALILAGFFASRYA